VPVNSWSGDAGAWPEDPVMRGALRISGTVLDPGATWYVTTDRLGWSTVVLLSEPEPAECWDAFSILRRCAEANCDPVRTALALRDRLREHSIDRCRRTGLAVARIGPHGRLVELVNVSLPTVLHWDPIEGLSPYEPIFHDLDALTGSATSEMLRLRPGSALVLTTPGVLDHHASWSELRRFALALGLDPLGGTVADAPPSELARVLRSSWGGADAPSGIVVIGLPGIVQQVA
jgi:hypothetical protein